MEELQVLRVPVVRRRVAAHIEAVRLLLEHELGVRVLRLDEADVRAVDLQISAVLVDEGDLAVLVHGHRQDRGLGRQDAELVVRHRHGNGLELVLLVVVEELLQAHHSLAAGRVDHDRVAVGDRIGQHAVPGLDRGLVGGLGRRVGILGLVGIDDGDIAVDELPEGDDLIFDLVGRSVVMPPGRRGAVGRDPNAEITGSRSVGRRQIVPVQRPDRSSIRADAHRLGRRNIAVIERVAPVREGIASIDHSHRPRDGVVVVDCHRVSVHGHGRRCRVLRYRRVGERVGISVGSRHGDGHRVALGNRRRLDPGPDLIAVRRQCGRRQHGEKHADQQQQREELAQFLHLHRVPP